jgi:hypothetical protein
MTSPRHGKGKRSVEMMPVGVSRRWNKWCQGETGPPLSYHQKAFPLERVCLHTKRKLTLVATMEGSQILGKHTIEDNTELINEKDSIGRRKLDIDIKEGHVEDDDGDEMMAVEQGMCASGVSQNNSQMMGWQPYWRKT